MRLSKATTGGAPEDLHYIIQCLILPPLGSVDIPYVDYVYMRWLPE